ncbi:MAG: hypothetical protein J6K91_05920 [Opitutales bacterium]|nr:hypothetical protein [Opitutales bacterium]
MINITKKIWGTWASPADIARDLGVQNRTVNCWITQGLMGEYITLPSGRGGNKEYRVKTVNYKAFLEKRMLSGGRIPLERRA